VQVRFVKASRWDDRDWSPGETLELPATEAGVLIERGDAVPVVERTPTSVETR
jgi:hypothetical protein